MSTNIVTKESILNTTSEGETDEEWPSIKMKLHLGMQRHKKAVGFAAIQFGIPKRAFVISAGTKYIYFKNPRYFKLKDKTYLHKEGCMSIPDKRYKVERYSRVQIHDDINGTQTFVGFTAAVIQHEMDHIDGITIKEKGL